MPHIPQWKRLLSYLTDIRLDESGSAYNPHLEVLLAKGRLQLVSRNAVYSYDDLYLNFYRAFRQIDIGERDIKSALVLGLGLGSVPYMLEYKFGVECHFTAVELDPEVIYLAEKWSLPRLQSPITTYQADAAAYVYTCTEQFDLITVDVFDDDKVPVAFEQPRFLARIRELLTPNGILLYNRLAALERDVIATQHFYEYTFKPAFPQGTYMDTRGNWMLCNVKP